MDRVVSVTVMLADMSEWAEMNKIYVTYFPVNRPARNAFGTTRLALGARVEIRHARSGKGSLVIHYSSLDELDGILDRFMGSRRR